MRLLFGTGSSMGGVENRIKKTEAAWQATRSKRLPKNQSNRCSCLVYLCVCSLFRACVVLLDMPVLLLANCCRALRPTNQRSPHTQMYILFISQCNNINCRCHILETAIWSHTSVYLRKIISFLSHGGDKKVEVSAVQNITGSIQIAPTVYQSSPRVSRLICN